jgi:septal ring factor EnvC (AmiA/AmiB activator)
VTYRTEDDSYDTPDDEPRHGVLVLVVVITMLASTGVGSAFLWRAYGGSLAAFPLSASVASPTAVADEKPVRLKDLQALQQQIAESRQSSERLLAAQHAEVKRLSDEVTVLSAKLDLIQRPIASAQASLPRAVPQHPAPAAQKKKPAAPQAAGPISTGGTPLPPPIQLTR